MIRQSLYQYQVLPLCIFKKFAALVQRKMVYTESVSGKCLQLPTTSDFFQVFPEYLHVLRSSLAACISSLTGHNLKAFFFKLGEPGNGTLKEMQDALDAIDELLASSHSVAVKCTLDSI